MRGHFLQHKIFSHGVARSRSSVIDSLTPRLVNEKGFKYKKGMFLYSAVSSPLDRSKCFTLHPTGRAVRSNNNNSTSLGSNSSQAAITREDYPLTFPPPSTARYSFIQPNYLWDVTENENSQTSKWQKGADSNPGSQDCESGILPLSTHVTNIVIKLQRCIILC